MAKKLHHASREAKALWAEYDRLQQACLIASARVGCRHCASHWAQIEEIRANGSLHVAFLKLCDVGLFPLKRPTTGLPRKLPSHQTTGG